MTQFRRRLPARAARIARRVGFAVCAVALCAIAAPPLADAVIARLDLPPIERIAPPSVVALDREGLLLRPFATDDGRWRLPVEPADVDPRYVAMLLAYEDKRFRAHSGVDVRAALRAAWQAARRGRIISGASTLTMQVARLIEPAPDRTLDAKIREMGRALALERAFDKNEILRFYLALAPFGGNLEGVRAASLAYFGKEPRRLSNAEAALLVALPQSPEARRPDRHPEAARRARDRVLARVHAAGVISESEIARARSEPVPTERRPFPILAAHAAEAVRAANPKRGVHRLAIDARLQADLERLLRDRVGKWGEKVSAAILVVRNETGEVLAHIGGPNLFDEARSGHVDLTRAIRSPGSALKPVIYALAFEDGLAHPETLIEDRPTRFGAYAPENFDEDFHGTVTAREALARSLNVPAVQLLEGVGPARMAARLKSSGVRLVLPEGEAPGIAIGLGGAGVTLHDLAALYAAFARNGVLHSLSAFPRDAPTGPGRRVLKPVAAWYVTDALASATPPANALGGRIAYKTGTSYGYRDAWAIGYESRHTIAVWMGRPDGAPVPGMVARAAAAPLLFDAFARLGARRAPLPPAPPGTLRVTNAELPLPLRRLRIKDALPVLETDANPPLLIAFPPDGARIDSGEPAGLMLKADGGELPLTWIVDGRPIGRSQLRREIVWRPEGRGFARISVIDASGDSRTATIRVD